MHIIYRCMYVCVYVCMYVCMYVRTYVPYVRMYVCTIVWEIFDSKNISWVLATTKIRNTEILLSRLITSYV